VKAPSATKASPVIVTAVDPALYEEALRDVRALRKYGSCQPAPGDDRLPPTDDPRCGTRGGYTAHRRRGERACTKCLNANAGRPVDSPVPDLNDTWRHA
jgi:hypothetical protein